MADASGEQVSSGPEPATTAGDSQRPDADAGRKLLVSVVISTRNRADMLNDCMNGLARQTIGRDRFEVVLVDNCSTEDLTPTIENARSLGLDLRVLRTAQDRGPGPARNLGVEHARGAIIAFTDSDCRPVPEWLAVAVEAFREPEVAFVAGPVLPKPEQPVAFTSRVTFITHGEHPSFPTANLLMRRDVFVAHGGFDPALSFTDPFGRATECADTDLAWRVLRAGHQRRFLPQAVMQHEVEKQKIWMWIIEPTRLFLVPALVRRHPQLRREMLTWGLFFYAPAATLYVAVPFALVAAWMFPWLLAMLPAALLARSAVRTRSLDPVVLVRQSLRVIAHLPRCLVVNAALLYGSLRFRCLVL